MALSTFEDRAAKLVPLGGRTWWGAPRFDAIPRDATVRRAKRLAEAHPAGLYDLFGYNCEQAANFCSTNSYESYQVRGYFAVRSLVGIPIALWATARIGNGQVSRGAFAAVAAWVASGLLTHALRDLRGACFMRKVGRPLLTWGEDGDPPRLVTDTGVLATWPAKEPPTERPLSLNCGCVRRR